MNYSELLLYLKTNLKRPSLQFEWTIEDNHKFFNFLDENAPTDFLTKRENLLAIRRAFKEYFEHIGYILFQIRNYKIKLKIFEYKLQPQDSENVDEIISLIEDNEEFIIDDYNGKPGQVLLEKDLKDKIYALIGTLEEEKINKKELVKYAVREAFELEESDIVMVKEKGIFIKMFDTLPRDEKEQRYNGIDEKELEAFNAEHFSNTDDREFFNLVARLFVDRYLLEKNINNQEYEKNVFSYVQSIITEQLMNTFDHCEEFFTGLSGYIFRIHFVEVFENIAEAMLVELAISNDFMLEFLKYYSMDVIVVAGYKYRVPALEAENGLRWNVVSMLSIVKLYVKTNSAGKLIKHAIEKKEEEMETYLIDGYTPVEYNNICIAEKNTLVEKLTQHENTIERCLDSMAFAKTDNEKESLEKEIRLMKEDIIRVKEEQKKLLDRTISRIEINIYMTIEKEIGSLRMQLKREQKILGQNEKAFMSIQKALVKALMSKKKLITNRDID